MPPLKSVVVAPTKRGGGRKQPSPTISTEDDDAPIPATPLARPVRRVAAQPEHRYRVGERLRMTGGGQSVQRTSSACNIVSLLPYEGRGALLYRVRSDAETYERIVSEADLSRD